MFENESSPFVTKLSYFFHKKEKHDRNRKVLEVHAVFSTAWYSAVQGI